MKCPRGLHRATLVRFARSAPIILGTVAAVLGGCAGNAPPMRYFTLNQLPPATPPAVAQGTGVVPPATRLAAVTMPVELDRQELVTHSDVNQVQVHESNRWAGALDEQIRRTLSGDLASRVTITTPPIILDPGSPAGKEPVRTLTVSLPRLDVDAQCAVSLTANWTLQGGGVAPQRGSEQVDQPAAGGSACPAAAAATISQALAVLADRLAPYVVQATPQD